MIKEATLKRNEDGISEKKDFIVVAQEYQHLFKDPYGIGEFFLINTNFTKLLYCIGGNSKAIHMLKEGYNMGKKEKKHRKKYEQSQKIQ